MLQDATCPKCRHTFPVTEARGAFTVTCPRCDALLTVEFKKPSTPPEAGQPPFELLVKPGALAHAAPAKPKRHDDDDDEEEKKAGGSMAIVLISGALGLLFVLGGLALTGWVLFTQIDTDPDPPVVNRNNSNNNSNSGIKGGNDTKGNTGGNKNNNFGTR